MWILCLTAAFTLERSAIVTGGPKGEAAVTAAQKTLQLKLVPVLEELQEAPVEARAKRLLELVQYDFGRGALLKRHAANASSLYDVVASGRFNAISGAVLYYLVAKEAGLAAAVLLRDGDVVVAVAGEIVRFGPAPAMDAVGEWSVDRHGLDGPAIVALIPAQKAVASAVRGEAAAFADWLKTAAATSREYARGSLASFAMEPARTPEEAAALYRYVFELAPDDTTRQRVEQAVAVLVDRRLAMPGVFTPRQAEAWARPLDPFVRFRFDALARLLVKADHPRSGAAIDVALRSCEGQRCEILRTLDVDRLLRLSERDAVSAATAFLERHGVGVFPEAARVIGKNHVLALTGEARCRDAQDAANGWSGMLEPGVVDAPIESCFIDNSLGLIKQRRYDVAADELRTAMKSVKDDTRVRTTLVNAVSRQVMELLKEKRCDDARPWLEEGRLLDPNEVLFDQGFAFCKRLWYEASVQP